MKEKWITRPAMHTKMSVLCVYVCDRTSKQRLITFGNSTLHTLWWAPRKSMGDILDLSSSTRAVKVEKHFLLV